MPMMPGSDAGPRARRHREADVYVGGGAQKMRRGQQFEGGASVRRPATHFPRGMVTEDSAEAGEGLSPEPRHSEGEEKAAETVRPAATGAFGGTLVEGHTFWVDVRDENGLWWPGAIVGLGQGTNVVVRVPRLGTGTHAGDATNDFVVDANNSTHIAPAGSHAFYGMVETVAKAQQVVILQLPKDPKWYEARILTVSNMGIARCLLLSGGPHQRPINVNAAGNRLRPIGPSKLTRFNRVPLQSTLRFVASLQALHPPAANAVRRQHWNRDDAENAGQRPQQSNRQNGNRRFAETADQRPQQSNRQNGNGGFAENVGQRPQQSNRQNGNRDDAENAGQRPQQSTASQQTQRRVPLSATSSAVNQQRQETKVAAPSTARRRLLAPATSQFGHFERSLVTNNLTISQCLGDGNCLYRAIADQLYGNQELHGMIRHMAFMHMRAYENEFAPFCAGVIEQDVAHEMRHRGDYREPSDVFSQAELFRRYMDHYSRDRVWGGDPEISALCRVYGRTANIFGYDRGAGHRIDVRDVVPGAPPLMLSYYGGGHYDSIRGPDFQRNLLRTEPMVVESSRTQEYQDLIEQAARGGGQAPPAGSSAADNPVSHAAAGDAPSTEEDKDAELAKKDLLMKNLAAAKLFGTSTLGILDDEKMLKELEDENVQAVVNRSTLDDVDKVNRADDIVSDEFRTMQQLILDQVAQGQTKGNINDHVTDRDKPTAAQIHGRFPNAGQADDANPQPVSAAPAAGLANDFAGMTEEQQVEYLLMLSASENPELAAVPADPPAPAGAMNIDTSSAAPPATRRTEAELQQLSQLREMYGDALPDDELLSIASALGQN